MNITKTIIRLLTFRITREELLQLNIKHFIAGLIGTWIVGIGRNWDNPRASLLQHSGIGSIIYIFSLSVLIWLIIAPYYVEKWNYFKVLIFISLTSFPAIIYAIPVEKFFSMSAANTINVWFLAIVASWRLALLYFFLKRYTQLENWYITVATLLPVCIIITSLTFLNLDKVVFDFMGGINRETPHDSAYIFLFYLTAISTMIVIPLLIGYVIAIIYRRKLFIKGKS